MPDTRAARADTSRNEFAERRRTEKALALVDLLAPMGFTPELVKVLPADARRTAEAHAGVRQCSDVTWERVASMLANRIEAQARIRSLDIPTADRRATAR